MAYTVEQVDAKIAQLQQHLDFWRKARDVVSNPLFAELSSEASVVHQQATHVSDKHSFGVDTEVPLPERQYGRLKRITLECLPFDGTAVTPQELAKRIEATGFVFNTKTPSISVNDTLQSLRDEGKAMILGKSDGKANLWIRALTGVKAAIEKEAPEETS